VPFPNLQQCTPNTLSQDVRIRVRVTDPSGVSSVTLKFRRPGDSADVSRVMSRTLNIWSLELSTSNNPPAWYPAANSQSYVVQLSVTATDSIGNSQTTPTAPGFTVTFCQ